MEILFSNFSGSVSPGITVSDVSNQTPGELKTEGKCPFLSLSMNKNQSASTEFGQMTHRDKGKINIGAVFLLEDYKL